MRSLKHVEHVVDDNRHLGDRQTSILTFPSTAKSFPLEQWHHDIRTSLLVLIVIENVDRSRVFYLIRDIGLAAKEAPHIEVVDVVLEQKFHGDSMTIAMCRSVDRGHTTHANQSFNTVLSDVLSNSGQQALRHIRQRIPITGHSVHPSA
ncbi:hypothetical protein LZC95_42215 [Pendulispora brunnea]|uniref:Uncharacterized protein n=1 Tax=Pendulispora brunnea TaxID=2905690 RepID=A0ABZ2K878_9BACT